MHLYTLGKPKHSFCCIAALEKSHGHTNETHCQHLHCKFVSDNSVGLFDVDVLPQNEDVNWVHEWKISSKLNFLRASIGPEQYGQMEGWMDIWLIT